MAGRVLVLIALWLSAGTGAAWAQQDATARIEAMQSAYERLDYDSAVRYAEEVLADVEAHSVDQLVQAHTTLGLVYYAQSEPLEARVQFAAALSLNPALRLDPLLVSPKTLDFFDEVRAEVAEAPPEARGEAEVRYVRVYDPRPAATLRSLAVPGWGQLYKGERAKGWALVGLWSAAVAGTAAAHLARSRAEDDYLAATDPAVIAERYDTFDRWHRTRGAFAAGAAVVWAVAAADALAFGGPERRAEVGPMGRGLGVRFRF